MRSEIMALSKDRTVDCYSGSSVSCMVVDETEQRFVDRCFVMCESCAFRAWRACVCLFAVLGAETHLGLKPVTEAMFQKPKFQTQVRARRSRDAPGSQTLLAAWRLRHRYLLCGYRDGSLSVVDVEDDPRRARRTFDDALRVERGQAHKYCVTGCAWYPVDTGMFVTSGFDATVKVWDTNTCKAVHTYTMPGKIHCMSICPSVRHSLVASGASR